MKPLPECQLFTTWHHRHRNLPTTSSFCLSHVGKERMLFPSLEGKSNAHACTGVKMELLPPESETFRLKSKRQLISSKKSVQIAPIKLHFPPFSSQNSGRAKTIHLTNTYWHLPGPTPFFVHDTGHLISLPKPLLSPRPSLYSALAYRRLSNVPSRTP